MSLEPGSSVDKEAASFEAEPPSETASFETDVRLPVSLRQPSRDAAPDLFVRATRATTDMSG